MEDYRLKQVSVIIPTYSRPQFLPRAIESVLAQTFSNIEIIVVDDNGDGTQNQKYTEELIREYIENNKIIYIKHKVNKNGSAARNTGVRNSHGNYIAFLDDDDQFLPTKIEKQVAKLEKAPEKVGACYCNWAWYNEEKLQRINDKLGKGNLTESLFLMENSICGGSSLLIRSNVYKDLNGFDESFYRHQDWEFLIRFFRKYEIGLVNEVLIHIHIESRIYTSNPEIGERHRLYYLQSFKGDISKCKKSKDIYRTHYFYITHSYFSNGQFRKGCQWLKKANIFGNVGMLNIIKCIYVYFRSFANK